MEFSDDDDAIDSEVEARLYSQIHHVFNEREHDTGQDTSNKPTMCAKKVKLSKTKSSQSDFPDIGEPTAAFVNVVHYSELKAEKPNRVKLIEPLSHSSILSSKSQRSELKRKRKEKPSVDSSESDIYCIEDEPENVVINIDSSSDTSCVIVDEEIQTPENISKIPDDRSLWKLNLEDRYKIRESSNGFSKIQCYNCRERGHLSKSCTKPKHFPCCFLCGQPGHSGEKCWNPFCSKCLQPGHEYWRCRWANNQINCCYCNTKGHLWQECPLHWRRYHLTTVPGSIVKTSQFKSKKRSKPIYCYNCGGQDHYGYACVHKRIHGFIFPTDRRILNYMYNDPNSVSDETNLKEWKNKLDLATKSSQDFKVGSNRNPQRNRRSGGSTRRKGSRNANAHCSKRNFVTVGPSSVANFPRAPKHKSLVRFVKKDVRRISRVPVREDTRTVHEREFSKDFAEDITLKELLSKTKKERRIINLARKQQKKREKEEGKSFHAMGGCENV